MKTLNKSFTIGCLITLVTLIDSSCELKETASTKKSFEEELKERLKLDLTLTVVEENTPSFENSTNGRSHSVGEIVDVFTPSSGPRIPGTWRPNAKYHQVEEKYIPKLLWQGEPLVHPRGIMLDPDFSSLWIADPGDAEKDPINKPARIIRVPLVYGKPTKPLIFFQKSGFLWSAKFALPVVLNGQRALIVADQGEPTSEYTFTGRGAKVFVLPILEGNIPGEPIVLWEGKPFVCPTGVEIVKNIIYITDPCAGPQRQDPSNPQYTFPTSSIFTMRNEVGVRPTVLFSGDPFTSLIGITSVAPNELIINDTDSGRPDRGSGLISRPGFSPARSADRWILHILDADKPILSEPKRTLYTEQGDIQLNFRNNIIPTLLGLSDSIVIEGIKGTRIVTDRGPVNSITIQINSLDSLKGDPSRKFKKLVIASDVMADVIALNIRPKLVQSQRSVRALLFDECQVEIKKDCNRGNLFADNKDWTVHKSRLPARVSNTSRPNNFTNLPYRITLDNNRNHGSIWIYPDAGGTPKVLSIGPPLSRPLGSTNSMNNETLWFTDQQTGSLYAIPLPSIEVFNNLYGYKN